MPQLNTSTWTITIMSMLLALFILFQLKLSKHTYFTNPETTPTNTRKHNTPWELKWTKIYLPLSSPQHS
uniref:ATP synthase complex subunit 8 n=1 Tax=Tragulus napu TaxID=9848 RepID=A0A343CEI1_TRANA|nr:ATP synthase F0 subunit 8 [Tragulus napu]ARM56474.1 ATP synthase F0 subunit 8 [Tragulus napu]